MNKKWRQVSTRFIEFGLANQPNTESGLTQRQRGIIHPQYYYLSINGVKQCCGKETAGTGLPVGLI